MSWLESWMPNAREYMQMRPGNAGNTNGAKSPLDKVNSIDDISGNLSTPEQKAQQALQDTMKQSLGVVNLSANIVNVIGGSTGALPTGPNGQSAIGAKGSTLWSNIQAAAKNFGMNADVVKAIMTTESSGDPNQVNHNPKGDHVGLMQIGQTTLDSYNKANPNNQYTWAQMKSTFPNLEVGAWDLKRAYDRSNGNMNTALSHYNGAPVGSAAAAKYIGSVWGNYHPAEAHLMGNNVTTGNQ
jgi:soluble lytic murein transglycosylase-like protein